MTSHRDGPAGARLVLASASRARAELLKNAGVDFETRAARIDERAIEATLQQSELDGADIALLLAQAKADNVSADLPGAAIIGCDQTLCLDGAILHKPANRDEAIERLLALSARTHQLHSGVCIVKNRELLWSRAETANITFRKLEPGFVGRHLAGVGAQALASVGAYQIEALGIQLVERIDGDYFSILGLPLLPLLAQLRQMALIDG